MSNLKIDRIDLINSITLNMELYGHNCDLNKYTFHKNVNMSNVFNAYPHLTKFNGDISKWDVSQITQMNGLFKNSEFNRDISNWDVSNVKDMSEIFWASKFNGDLSKWKISPNCKIDNAFNYFHDSVLGFSSVINNLNLIGDNPELNKFFHENIPILNLMEIPLIEKALYLYNLYHKPENSISCSFDAF